MSTYPVSRLFAITLAHHLQVDQDLLVDADRVDLEHLLPLSGVLGALDHLNLGWKQKLRC